MKRTLSALAALFVLVAVFAGVASAGKRAAKLTTKNSSTTTKHVCNQASSGQGGGMSTDDMDNDGDTITLTGPTVLWPPNHKYVNETITASDVDGTLETADLQDGVTLMTTATSNQPESGLGSGNTKDDAVVNGPTSGSESVSQTIQLRAERDGVDPAKAGRTYTITAMATFDGSTTASMTETCTATFTVHVPHDQGNN